MKNRTEEDLEFEENRKKFLEDTKRMNKEKQKTERVPITRIYEKQNDEKIVGYGIDKEDGKHAWEYEIEQYRKRKKTEKMCMVGFVCGVGSLLITLIVNWNEILSILGLN